MVGTRDQSAASVAIILIAAQLKREDRDVLCERRKSQGWPKF
jgi:hypothetical protein